MVLVNNSVHYVDDIDCLYGTIYGILCNSLDEQLNDYNENEGNKKSDDECDSEYMLVIRGRML